MKHIIFEGIDCAGKTTTIQRLSDKLKESGISSRCIDEISDSPIYEVQQKIFQEDPFFRLNESFKTSLFETFLLAADAVYRQEKMFAEAKNDMHNSVYLYDRDIPSVLVYQSLILKDDYPKEYQSMTEHLSHMILNKNHQFDGIVFIDIPLQTIVERTMKRENRRLNLEQIDFLKKVRHAYDTYLEKVDLPVLKLSGLDNIDDNINKIINTFSLENMRKEKNYAYEENQTYPPRHFDGNSL